jgi:hypothetical protein
MRLSTVHENLARRFQQAPDPNDARRIFEKVFRACARRIESRWYALLRNEQLALRLAAGELPEGFDFNALSAEMDAKYFDAEDQGRDDDSAAYFTLARLMLALSFAATAADAAAFSEATYEAIVTLPNPKEDSAAFI